MEKSNPLADLVAWITLLDAWTIIGIGMLAFALVWLFWMLNRGNSRFNFGDAFIDNTTGQTSYLRIIIFGCFINAWCVVYYDLMHGKDVQNFVGIILGIFVTNIIMNRGFEVFDPRVKAAAINTAPAMANQPPADAQVVGDITTKVEVKP